MAPTTNAGQGIDKEVSNKELYQKKDNSKRLSTCLKSLKGMSVYEAEKFIFRLVDEFKKSTKVI